MSLDFGCSPPRSTQKGSTLAVAPVRRAWRVGCGPDRRARRRARGPSWWPRPARVRRRSPRAGRAATRASSVDEARCGGTCPRVPVDECIARAPRRSARPAAPANVGQVGRYREHRQHADAISPRAAEPPRGRRAVANRARTCSTSHSASGPAATTASCPPHRVGPVASEHRRHDLRIDPPAALDQRERPFVLEHRPRRDDVAPPSAAAGGQTGRGSCRGRRQRCRRHAGHERRRAGPPSPRRPRSASVRQGSAPSRRPRRRRSVRRSPADRADRCRAGRP